MPHKDAEDILVKREAIMVLFDPPLPKSTFHDRANRGEFASSKVSGYYLLNKTRKKLGMDPVDVAEYRQKLASIKDSERQRQLFHAALAVTVPEAIDAKLPLELPSEMTREESETVLAKYKSLHQHLKELKLTGKDARVGFVAGELCAYSTIT